jgi:DNA-binding NtrC family response regulator
MPCGTETLLVVESDRGVRILVCSVLESLGYTVLRAINWQEGQRVTREHRGQPVRLVVGDVSLPQSPGPAMAEWLKSTRPDLKFLFTSGYIDDDAPRGLDAERIATLPKPYTPEQLAFKVRTMLDP